MLNSKKANYTLGEKTIELLAVSYKRYSSEAQNESSLQVQQHHIEAYAERNGIKIIKEFQDKAKSGKYIQKRDGFLNLLDFCKANKVSYVLCYRLNRLSRDLGDFFHFRKELHEQGIRIISVMENIITSDETLIHEAFALGEAQHYVARLSTDTTLGLLSNSRLCRHNGGKPPFSMEVDPVTKMLVENPTES